MCFLIEDKSGNLVKEEWFDPPYVGMVHDFAITTDYVIFPIFPTTMDPERLKAGGDHWKWDGSLPSWVGIMPRAGSTTDIRWFKVPTSCGFHVINGFNEGTIVHLDMMISKRNGFPYIGDIAGSAADPQDGVPYPTRWSFDMTSNAVDGGFSSKSLAPYGGELPLIDPRCVGRDYRYAYISMVDPERRILMAGPTYMGANMIGKIDLTTGEVQTYHGTDETSFQEGAFIPRGPGEDEGWYINIADRHDQNRSDLLIFDARAISEGPLATARLPIRLRSAFHTTWVPGV
jgi:carotenoid cleavage dioxygenase